MSLPSRNHHNRITSLLARISGSTSGVEYPKAASGRQFSGYLRAFNPAGKQVFSANVISGGNIEPNSRVEEGYDTSVPSGNYKVQTKIPSGKIGFLVLNVPGRSAIEVHMGGVTTGCIAMLDNWDLMQQNMGDTAKSGTNEISISIWYQMTDHTDVPYGNRGGSGRDPGIPPGYWPEVDP